jgi:anthranilate phosphoribosyltransferase
MFTECSLNVLFCSSKFHHENYMAAAKERTDLGIRLVAVDLQNRLPPLKATHSLVVKHRNK